MHLTIYKAVSNINAGMLNNKIVIQKMDITRGDIGQEIKAWVDYAVTYAYINGLSGEEYWNAAARQAENTIVFTLRYSKLIGVINPLEYRILFDGKIFDIKTVDNVQYKNQAIKLKGVANYEQY